MFFRVLAESWRRRKRKKILAVVSVALGAGVASALLSVVLDAGDRVQMELRRYGANIVVAPRVEASPIDVMGMSLPLGGAATLDEAAMVRLKGDGFFWRNNLLGVAPFSFTEGRPAAGGAPVTVAGVWFRKDVDLGGGGRARMGLVDLAAGWKLTGYWPDEGAPDQAVAGRSVASRFGLEPGAMLSLAVGDAGAAPEPPAAFRITGVVETGREEDDYLFVNLPVVQAARREPARVGRILVSALTTPDDRLVEKLRRDPTASLTRAEAERYACTPYVSTIAAEIEETIRGAAATPVRRVVEAEGHVLGRVKLLMLAVAAAAVVAAGLGVLSTMAALVLERQREAALLDALGAGAPRIVAVFLAEAAAIGFVGGASGYAVGLLLARAVGLSVFGVAPPFQAVVMPATIGLALAVAVGGALVPVLRALRIPTSQVLHGR